MGNKKVIKTNSENGFTLLEVIAVLVILGVLTAYVAKTSTDIISAAEKIGEINRVKSHLKYAQSQSINTVGYWGIDFRGSSYALFKFVDPVPAAISYFFFPGEEKNISNPTKADVALPEPDSSKYGSCDKLIWFDNLGVAYSAGTSPIAVKTEIAASLPIVTLGAYAAGASEANTVISIKPRTGYVKCDYK